MNTLPHWNQLSELVDLWHSWGSLFGCSKVLGPEGGNKPLRVAQRVPLVDISETAQRYLIKAELPQVKREDIKITLEDGTLTIRGNRKFEENRKKDRRVQPADGSFVHRFSIPIDASPADGTAEFKEGVLLVHLDKYAKPRRRAAAVEAAADNPTPNDHFCSSGWGINE